MRYKVLTSVPGGIVGFGVSYDTVDAAMKHQTVKYHAPYVTHDEMMIALREWAGKTEPGGIFETHMVAVITLPLDPDDESCPACEGNNTRRDELEHEAIMPEQSAECLTCGTTWVERYVLAKKDIYVDN